MAKTEDVVVVKLLGIEARFDPTQNGFILPGGRFWTYSEAASSISLRDAVRVGRLRRKYLQSLKKRGVLTNP
jgi:hypothetical protein